MKAGAINTLEINHAKRFKVNGPQFKLMKCCCGHDSRYPIHINHIFNKSGCITAIYELNTQHTKT